MTAVSPTNPYGVLSLAVTPATSGTGDDTANIAVGQVVVGFIAGESNRSRKYNPFAVGLTPVTGDAPGKWLPTVSAVTLVAAPGDFSGNTDAGQVFVQFTPGTADVVNVASVQSIRVDPSTVFITATGAF